MGKEKLISAFGLMNETVEASNIKKPRENNTAFLSGSWKLTGIWKMAEKFGPLLEDARD